MMYIYKGNFHFSTKGDLVYDLLTQYKAPMVSITKSNARINNDNKILPFNDFNFEHKFFKFNSISANVSRTTLAIKKCLKYERLNDLENDTTSDPRSQSLM